jgi:hypothetical protein
MTLADTSSTPPKAHVKKQPKWQTGLSGTFNVTWGEFPPPRISLPEKNAELEVEHPASLAQTAQGAVDELMARAFHGWVDRWSEAPAPDLESELSAERAEADRKLRQAICEGAQSSDRRRRRLSIKLRQYLIDRDRREARRAAMELAIIGTRVADWLEYLGERRPDLLKEVAPHLAVWPFNLGLSRPRRGGKRGLLRAKVAKAHLTKMGLGEAHHPLVETTTETGVQPRRKLGDGPSVSRVAAEQVLNALYDIRRRPSHYLRVRVVPSEASPASGRTPFEPLTPWGRKLFALQVPMTKDDWPEWWSLARVLLIEQWDKSRSAFQLLVDASGLGVYLKPPTCKPSKVKSRIIDQLIKNEFKLLAI